MYKLNCKITFTEGLLGTSPNDQDLYRNYIASKAPDATTMEDEVGAVGVDGMVEKGMTVFPRTEDGQPFLYDYQIKGFYKDACSMLSRQAKKDPETGKKVAVNESSKLTAFKKIIDGMIFPTPRQIVIHMPEGKGIGICQRPLRAQTAQGERVALSISEEVPAGSWCEFTVVLLDESHVPAVMEWMDYGALRGIGQWRNSGKGRFTWEWKEEE